MLETDTVEESEVSPARTRSFLDSWLPCSCTGWEGGGVDGVGWGLMCWVSCASHPDGNVICLKVTSVFSELAGPKCQPVLFYTSVVLPFYRFSSFPHTSLARKEADICRGGGRGLAGLLTGL